jgi:spore coat protein A, manganese oxidase
MTLTRRSFLKCGAGAGAALSLPMQPPDPTERGFKDTVKANPAEFTTIPAKYDLPTGVTEAQIYVYHCHILEHEDNDMMRPFTVVP